MDRRLPTGASHQGAGPRNEITVVWSSNCSHLRDPRFLRPILVALRCSFARRYFPCESRSPSCRHHYGRQWPLGAATRPSASGGPRTGRKIDPRMRRCGHGGRSRISHPLRVFIRELEASRHGGPRFDEASGALPGRKTQRNACGGSASAGHRAYLPSCPRSASGSSLSRSLRPLAITGSR